MTFIFVTTPNCPYPAILIGRNLYNTNIVALQIQNRVCSMSSFMTLLWLCGSIRKMCCWRVLYGSPNGRTPTSSFRNGRGTGMEVEVWQVGLCFLSASSSLYLIDRRCHPVMQLIVCKPSVEWTIFLLTCFKHPLWLYGPSSIEVHRVKPRWRCNILCTIFLRRDSNCELHPTWDWNSISWICFHSFCRCCGS